MFSLIFWQVYLLSTQNNYQSAQKITTNAVKPVLKPENKSFRTYYGKGTSYLRKINTKMHKKIANAIKSISKLGK